MSKRATGIVFICIAAFLYGVRYLSAAIFGSNLPSWNKQMFQEMLESVGNGPLVLSVIALVIGVVYLLFAEFGTDMSMKIKENWNAVDKD